MAQQYSSIPNQTALEDAYAQVQPQEIEFFTSHFPNQYKFTAKLRHLSPRIAIYLHQNIRKRSKDLKTHYQYDQNFNIVLQLPNSNRIWTKFTDTDFKIHYDHAKELPIGPLGKWHFYGSFSSTRKIQNSSFKFGAFNTFPQGVVDLRARFNIAQNHSEQYVYAKTLLNYWNFRFGFVGVFDMYRKFIQKNDLSLGCKINERNWVGGQLECETFRNYQINYSRFGNYFDLLRLGYVYTQDNLKIGLGYHYNIEQGQSKKLQAAVQFQTDTPLKWAKISFNTLMEAGVAAHVKSAHIPNLFAALRWQNITKNKVPTSASVTVQFNN